MSLVFSSASTSISPNELLRKLLPFHSQSFAPDVHYILSSDSKVLTVVPAPANPDSSLIPAIVRALSYFGYDSISVAFAPSDSLLPASVPLTFTPSLMDHSIVYDISDYFLENFPDVVLLQGNKNKKQPMVFHRGVPVENLRASWELSKKKLPSNVLICLRAQPGSPRLIIIDVDSHELAVLLCDMFPCLSLAPRQKTRKGIHFFFKADEDLLPKLTDCASQVRRRISSELSVVKNFLYFHRSFRDPMIPRASARSRRALGVPTRSTSRR